MKTNPEESYPNAMKRIEILRPGKYVSIPKDWLADRTLTPTAKLVLIVYIESLGKNNMHAYPGHDIIAKRIGMSPRGVQKCIEQLVAGGWLWSPGFSELATRKYCISCVRKPVASAQSALPAMSKGNEQSALPAGTECAPFATQSAPKVPKRSTEGPTEESYRSECGLPAAGLAALATASPVAQPDTAGADDQFNAEGEHVHAPSPALQVADAEFPASPEFYEAGDLAYAPDQPGYWEGSGPAAAEPVSGVASVRTDRTPAAAGEQREQAEEQATAPAARPAKKPSNKSGSKPKPKGLSDDQKRRACSSAEMMQRYILFGVAGLEDGVDVAKLAPTKANFYQHQTADGSPDLSQWRTELFAGYFWFLVAQHRGERGQPIELPNWGRLMKQISTLRETMPSDKAFQFLRIVASWFHVIRHLSGNAGHTMTLDETTLQNSLIATKARAIIEMDDDARSHEWACAMERYPVLTRAEAA